MASCIVCVKFSEKPGRPRLDGVDLGSPVAEFRERVSNVFDIPSTDINLVYCGKLMKDAETLSGCGVKAGCTVHILRKKLPEPEVKPEPLDDTAIRQLLNALHAALLNPAHRQAVHKILTSPETIDNIIAATPGMSTDHIAMSMLRDPQLLVQVADPDNVRRIVKAHPAIGHAVMHIAASVTEEAALGGRGGTLGQDAPLDPAFFPDLTSDEEMETAEGGPSTSQGAGQRSRGQGGQGGITTAQLTAALAAAGVGRPGNAGMMLRPFEGPVGGANQSPSSSAAAAPSSPRPPPNQGAAPPLGGGVGGGAQPLLTADIFRQAMSQALQVAQRGRGPGDATDGVTSAPPTQNFEPQMQQLRDMGLTDDTTNLRALQATGGDLQAALHLILEGRM
ncbi:ubiquitin-like protein 7 isoform X1 [Lytechinus variegatus]|uniref:ubiquitin-like protein 7 isoform X1 n=1 Tax=Lytechinus variegatus TaxID=7654 RepID=UPI001BB1461B|nr:ubiquitin-like protein 7 isoform X1 [Lytechinus variegatus]